MGGTDFLATKASELGPEVVDGNEEDVRFGFFPVTLKVLRLMLLAEVDNQVHIHQPELPNPLPLKHDTHAANMGHH